MMDSDSTCSSSKNDTISDVFHNDQIRYQRKGYGLIMAVVIFASYFTFFPQILKSMWPYFLSFKNLKLLQACLIFFFPLLLLVVGNLCMYVIYVIKLPFFERYRINNKPWDWEVDSVKWRMTLKKAIKQIAFNEFIVLAPITFIDILFLNGSKSRTDLESFPGTIEILLQIFFMMIIEDMAFYWSHRTLHQPYFYKKIHKIHHEFSNPISIAALYAHPLEYLFGNTLPTALGFIILGNRCHFATIMVWLALRIFETMDGHCGYEFSWSPYRLLPFSGSSEYHNFHHSHNVGTYSSFFILWDTFMGTNKEYFKYKARKEREDKLNQLRQEHKTNKLAKTE